MKRLTDIFFAFFGTILLFPFFIISIFLILLFDKQNPFYFGERVGKNFIKFKMIKLRTMKDDLAKKNVLSTAEDDQRITKIGKVVRKFKLDEFLQLINVLKGDMSLVGPRPNVQKDVDLYTDFENKILIFRPGITDFSSIVFADEGAILKNCKDPDLLYNQIIRPWKSRLALFYIEKQSFALDIKIIFLTLYSFIKRKYVLLIIYRILFRYQVSNDLLNVVLRKDNLFVKHPPKSREDIYYIK